MSEGTHERPRDPQALERLLVERQWNGDVDGMAALYEADAVLDDGSGALTVGREAIRALFAAVTATGKKFVAGRQSPAVVCGDLALTSTRLPDGAVTAEVARRQGDGTWAWVIDRYSVTEA
jgi:ketosteroid isomerase-like protein